MNWYTGISQMNVPYLDKSFKARTYDFLTTAPNGSFPTPYFGEGSNLSLMDWSLRLGGFLYVPDNLSEGTKMVVEIDYDLSDEEWKGSRDYLYIFLQVKETINSSSYSTEYSTWDALDPSKKRAKIEMTVADNSTDAL